MTREEAKKIIHRHVMLFSSMPDDVLEAIQTLEQEPCDTDTCKVVKAYMNEWDKPNNSDAISRQVVLDGIEELKKSPWATDKRGNGFEYLITEALDVVADLCVKQASSVNPQKTQMIDKSNFDQEQYKADLQCAYDCGKASVTPQPKTGHWEWLTEDKYRCSNCNHETRVDECMNEPMYDFCPFCGARMESEEV